MVNIYNIIILQILAPILLIANQLIAVHLIKLKMLKSFYYTFTISSVIMIFLLKLINLNFLLITIYFFFFFNFTIFIYNNLHPSKFNKIQNIKHYYKK
jgi:hypothetical protein